MNNNQFGTHRLTIQLTVIFIALILVLALLIGLPANRFLQSKLEHQAWSQVEQGQRAAIALYSARYHAILNLATLTAQSPTLQQLLLEADFSALQEYLETIQQSTDLTRIVICSPDDQILVTTDENVPEIICQKWKTGNYQYNPNAPQACLTAHQAIENETEILGEVFVCNQLDDTFATQISEAIGLENTIWINELPVATSFAGGIDKVGEQPSHHVIQQHGRTSHHTFEIDGVPYYSAHLPLEEAGLSAEIALDVREIQAAGDQLSRNLFITVFGVSFLGAIAAVVISRYISQTQQKTR